MPGTKRYRPVLHNIAFGNCVIYSFHPTISYIYCQLYSRPCCLLPFLQCLRSIKTFIRPGSWMDTFLFSQELLRVRLRSFSTTPSPAGRHSKKFEELRIILRHLEFFLVLTLSPRRNFRLKHVPIYLLCLHL